MRHQLLILLLTISFFSCQNESTTNENVQVHTKDSLYSDLDSFHIKEYTFLMETIPENIYNSLQITKNTYDTSEKVNLLRDSSYVSRVGDSLRLMTESGYVYLLNNSSDGDDLAHYTYLYFDQKINKYVISGSYWEAFDVVLIDKKTGEMMHVISIPTVSPNGKLALTSNKDLVAGFTLNGIELFDNTTTLKLIGTQELMDWGADDIKWLNDSIVFMKGSVLDTTSEYYEREECFKVTIKK